MGRFSGRGDRKLPEDEKPDAQLDGNHGREGFETNPMMLNVLIRKKLLCCYEIIRNAIFH